MIVNQLGRLETKINKIQEKTEAREKQITEINTRIDKIQEKNAIGRGNRKQFSEGKSN